jgi:integrase
LVLGFALGARRGEIAGLDLADVTETPEGLTIVVRRSKTDKDSAGRVVAVPYGANAATCPVRVVRAWITTLAGTDRTAGPLFVRVDRHGSIGAVATGRGSADGRITGQAVALIVKRATAAGLDPTAAWSGHSLRRGFATEAYRAGADRLRIARHGGLNDNSTRSPATSKTSTDGNRTSSRESACSPASRSSPKPVVESAGHFAHCRPR